MILEPIGCADMIDLHVHTNMSDGVLTPEEVVQLAAKRGLRALAVTDHDTVAGVARAMAEGPLLGVEVVAGVEISAEWSGGIMHILGYFVAPDNAELLSGLDWLAQGRRDRIPLILSKLKELGIHISRDRVDRLTDGGVPGRPHVANILLEDGYVRERQEAFDRFLKKGAPAYVPKVKLPPDKAIRLIRSARGLPALAHPYALAAKGRGELEDIIRTLTEYGLEGIEAYYSAHTRQQTDLYLDVARKFGLAVTGGSDFHGANKPEVRLGVIPAAGPLPYEILERLKSRNGKAVS